VKDPYPADDVLGHGFVVLAEHPYQRAEGAFSLGDVAPHEDFSNVWVMSVVRGSEAWNVTADGIPVLFGEMPVGHPLPPAGIVDSGSAGIQLTGDGSDAVFELQPKACPVESFSHGSEEFYGVSGWNSDLWCTRRPRVSGDELGELQR
jgi:hypothetical protein